MNKLKKEPIKFSEPKLTKSFQNYLKILNYNSNPPLYEPQYTVLELENTYEFGKMEGKDDLEQKIKKRIREIKNANYICSYEYFIIDVLIKLLDNKE